MQIPLHLDKGHLLLDLKGSLWLYDTGAPSSFGDSPLAIEGVEFNPPAAYMGLSASTLSEFTGVACSGLLGGDTHLVEVVFAGETFQLRCGTLPGLLGMTLMMAETSGIIGNSVLHKRSVGYFPRRGELSL